MQTANDLRDVDVNGLIREDVMNKIWDISSIPLPLTERIGTDSHGNPYCEWTQDKLAAAATDNAQIDGADITDDDTNEGSRVGNHSQISTKRVKVSTRAQESNTIGFSDALSYQVMMRQRELRRDVEATMLSNNGSVKAENATAGQSAGLGAWCTTNIDAGASTGGGFQNTGLVTARAAGAARGLTETMVRSVSRSIYENGGEATLFMSTPGVTEQFSMYLFDSSARVGTLQTETGQSQSPVTAVGAANVFVSDFSVLEIVPNRLQPEVSAGDANVYLIDPMLLRLSYLHGYRVEPLAKTGLADTRLMCVDWSLKVLNEEGIGLICDIDSTVAVTT